jgi:hypothetical protein
VQGFAQFEREQRKIQLFKISYSATVSYNPSAWQDYSTEEMKDEPVRYKISLIYLAKDKIQNEEEVNTFYSTTDKEGNTVYAEPESQINTNIRKKVLVMKSDYDNIYSPSELQGSIGKPVSSNAPDAIVKSYLYKQSFVKRPNPLALKNHIRKVIPTLSANTLIGFDQLLPSIHSSFLNVPTLSFYSTDASKTELESGGLYFIVLINAGKAIDVNIQARLTFHK